mmetsp:Transcript_21392/g.34517  ORF Transcript_21392/g.34517 Transcript_21392/m.34517 type:complete len:121 (-) Transcript_21392:787-1149(-)
MAAHATRKLGNAPAQWTQRATYTWEMIASKSIANLSKAPESGALDAVHATLTQVSALVTRDSSDDIASNFYVDLIWTTIAMVVAFVTIPAESAIVIKGFMENSVSTPSVRMTARILAYAT